MKTRCSRSSNAARLLFLLTILGPVFCVRVPAGRAQTAPPVTLMRLDSGGIQPQAAQDSQGRVHVIYFQGDPAGGNLYYTRFASNAKNDAAPLRVNSVPNSAGAMGTVRTAQIAIGKDDRVHVVWNGLGPKGENGYPTAYQAYARLNDAGTAFEPQRSLTTWAKGLDGGGSVAADRTGNVYVLWHALAGAKNEAGRAVFVAQSRDNGVTFKREKQANPELTGACACCGMRAFVDSRGILYALYRAAGANVNRDTMLLVSRDKGATFQEKRLHSWNLNACPMSTYALTENDGQVLAAWETRGRVFYGVINPADLSVSPPNSVAGEAQKHPALIPGPNGKTLLVWTEGTGWQRGGGLAWQVLTRNGPTAPPVRKPDMVPIWGLASAYTHPNGNFVILY
jgi:hypothetical protein